ncbi:MAG: NupC/NupG family nucleoside CNT transporter [Maricaulis sp.]|uniref:NupC/NupG family nucleoside CNT transporter n=1 Tax=Maricaulis sp. TaxID=1486257 RepID=UPI001B17B80E|nr:nucleoside transporter C-terminal domain-containing protein [Maricaulis sp.]MBO6729517.1 NupC/NupG family nucleoside CNT transporter [Maricaulis sp.]MBO6846994.1 NupC/NupG family nucleoside CNT transporter [Maricaulis sp.]MBO6876353.1 NupC/NupG family nucleoside CNT transporter [Maricaulis sp.]
MSDNLIAGFGAVTLLIIAFVFSTNKRKIRLRTVLSALALQAAIGGFVLYLPAGRSVLSTLSEGVTQLLAFSTSGIEMVFGPLVGESVGFSFALNVLPVVIFFSALMSVLYHIGVMQWIVRIVGLFLNILLGTGRVESLNAAANIFVGQTEAPLVIRPYLTGITKPQLFAIMTSGLASVAGTVLAAYAQIGISVEYLLAASFMAAPGGLLMASIIMPADAGKDDAQDIVETKPEQERHANVVMAAAVGAKDGLHLALNIGAMLIAFVSLIALVNGLIAMIAGMFGVEGVTIQSLLGMLFAPLMMALSIPAAEAQAAGAIVGEKLVINEFVAYLTLSGMLEEFSPRSQAILTIALCGFANLSSVGILLGGLGSLIPERMGQIAKFGFRAVLAGSLSNLMSAAIAGMLFAG